MQKKLIVFMIIALTGSLQTSEDKHTMQFIPLQPESYMQQGNVQSHLTEQLRAFDKDIRNDGYQMTHLCRHNRISEDQVFQVIEKSRLSPHFGVAAQFAKGISDNCRMSSPCYIDLKNKHNAQGVGDEQKKRCKRIMHTILNK